MKYKKGTFTVVPNMHILMGKPTELQTIFLWICSYANDEGQCYPSRAKLSRVCGIKSVRTVDKYLDELISCGLIDKETRKKPDGENYTNLYQVVQIETPPSATDDTPHRAPNSTLTIPNINYTHLTILEPTQDTAQTTHVEEPKQESNLPDYLGKNKLNRVVKLYNILWADKFGRFPTETPYGKYSGLLKPIMEAYTEYQIASLLAIHFSWHGTSGVDEFVYKQMSNMGFSLTMFRKNVDLYIAYLTNVLHVEYNSDEQIRRYVKNALGAKVAKYGKT